MIARGLALALVLTACRDRTPSREETKAKIERVMAGAQPGEERELEPGTFMTMFRQQATSPLPDGWHLATSTKGGFSVELPLAFNDFRMRAPAEDGVELTSDVIGGKTAGMLSWMATCATRADGKVKSAAPRVDKTESLGTPVKAWQRTIPVEGRICMAVVEAQGTDPLPPEADIRRFLGSFKASAPR